MLVSVAGAEGYVSPNWYQRPGDQVPTWNYVAIEIDGTARVLSEVELVEQLDVLAAQHEPRANPAAPWTRRKMDDGVFLKMLRGIIGFEIVVAGVRTTTKLSQNKPPADRQAASATAKGTSNGTSARATTLPPSPIASARTAIAPAGQPSLYRHGPLPVRTGDDLSEMAAVQIDFDTRPRLGGAVA